ncbi:uncharacterized protein Z520_04321 [Fonsecaea multimorphosa CBS 102226]|uniref:Uncharacterized protein n=1 Tax=Fonsecaea multimorphosa CBS 102226 TaxID=1442371 RepID=A0A0D2IRQ7_9EURO|nr:uncharacterized protein Z520_04321 [Fonsecaea multimorphosa CBS 102226]KIX99686.1 hypothetical protein Z520_04321 [Fonsecaea multimorphosa CBS 102226]OAL26737.1 hypothetical protein AYO22_04090 [Fonsecaea multimorphosa]
MDFPVAGKNAIVTGGASGINLAFVKLLVSKGANVIVGDLQESAALKELEKQPRSTKLLFQKTDVSKWSELEALFKRAQTELGPLDIVCNGAGVFEPTWSNFWNDTETESYKSLDINLTALIKGTRLAIRDQITRSKGRKAGGTVGVILNISSLAAQRMLFNQPIYSAAKAGVSAIVRSLAPLHEEFGIKVVAVAPGMVYTPLWSDHPEKLKAVDEKDIWITPEEQAAAMLDVVEKGEYEGGTVLETLKNFTRKVYIDSPMPEGPGSTLSNLDAITKDTIALLEEERKGGKVKNGV